MTEILIPRQEPAEVFEALERRGLKKALRQLQEEGHEPVYMPQLADARIQSSSDSEIWHNWYTTPSIRATGKTNKGSAVVVYAHTQNHFSDPDNIAQAVENHQNGAGPLPQKEFQRLVDIEGKTDEAGNQLVYVIPHEHFKDAPIGVIPVRQAMEHPQTTPFLGGEQRAQRYLDRHKEVHGDKIGVWHTDDLSDQPMGRPLFLGDHYSDLSSGINYCGRFLGVRAEGAAPKNEGPTSDQLERIVGDYLGPAIREEVTERLQALYN